MHRATMTTAVAVLTGPADAPSPRWRKSSFSLVNGNCVEVADAAPQPVSGWRKGSRSVNNGECVEAASLDQGVLVRDTSDRGGTVLVFPSRAWAVFTARIAEADL